MSWVKELCILTLFAIVAVGVDAIDPRQDLGHHGIELSRNLATDAAIFEHEAGQGLVFDDGNLVLAGDFADAQSVEAGAFGDDDGGFHGFFIVTEGDGEMGWISHNHISLRHFRKHPAFGEGLAAAALVGLDERVALGVFGFVLKLLAGHFEFLVGLPKLVP